MEVLSKKFGPVHGLIHVTCIMWTWAQSLFSQHILLFFFFQLFPSRVATADFPSPVVPIFCILLRHLSLSSFTTSINLLFAFPVSSSLATPSSSSFSQYTHHLSSVHVHTTSVSPLVFSLQTVPPVLSL